MKVIKQDIPESMKHTIVEVSNTREKNSIDILKEIKIEELARKKDNRRATLFVNLIYLMGLGMSVIMMLAGDMEYAMPSFVFMTLGAFVFNLFIYNESKRTQNHLNNIEQIHPTHESQKDN